MAQYATIVLDLIQEQYPHLHERLRSTRTLLATVNLKAAALKRHHEDWIEKLSMAKPDCDPMQISSQALELALEDVREDLSLESPADEGGGEGLSLDGAMAYLRRATPSE